MKTNIIQARQYVGKFILNTILAVASAVVLPQIFHAFGLLLGVGPLLGQMFLPMYIPVLVAGFFAGPWVGVVAGILSPVISSFFFEMPAFALLLYMVIELAFFGYFAGLFNKTKWNIIIKLLAAQVCARAVRIIAVAVVALIANNNGSIVTTLESFLIGLPGIAMQLLLVPVLYRFVKHDA